VNTNQNYGTDDASPPDTPPDQAESRTKPLPATERDFHTRPSRTSSPGFRIAIIIGVVVLLVVGFFVYRYVTSYEDTDDAEVDGYINSISARVSGPLQSWMFRITNMCRPASYCWKWTPPTIRWLTIEPKPTSTTRRPQRPRPASCPHHFREH